MATKTTVLAGLLVSEKVAEAAKKTWPVRPPTGYDDRLWQSACTNHVLFVAREHGEEPKNA